MAKDFKLVNNDLYIDPVTNDFKLVEADHQHVEDLIKSFPGWYKEFPYLGVGISGYDRTTGKQQELDRKIKVNLQSDNKGHLIVKTKLVNGEYIAEIQ